MTSVIIADLLTTMNTEVPQTPVDYVLQFKLWSKVQIAGENPDQNFYSNCWGYQGRRSEFGHGVFTHRQRSYYAHRVAYCLAHKIDIANFPPEVVVRHKCDNPACCNPLHLETGSQQDNQLDMEIRGRNPKGETHGMASIDAQTVLKIRWLFKECGGATGARRAIARRLGLTCKIVNDIVADKSWTCIPDDFSKLEEQPTPLTEQELAIQRSTPNVGNSELTELEVQRIRAFYKEGYGLTEIGKMFGGLGASGVHSIVNRRTWTHVANVPSEHVLTPEEITIARLPKVRFGDKHHGALLTNQQVREMRWLHSQQGGKYGFLSALGRRYNVHKTVARSVTVKESYAEVQDDFENLDPKPELISWVVDNSENRSMLTAQQVREMRWLAAQHPHRGIGVKIARQYGVSKETVNGIIRRATWKNLSDNFETLEPKPSLAS